MANKKIAQVQFILNLLVWLLLLMIPILFSDFSRGINWNHIIKIWKEYSLLFLIFLSNRFLLMPLLFLKGKRIPYFLSITGIIIVFSAVLFLGQDFIVNTNTLEPRPRPDQGPPRLSRFEPPKGLIPPYANLIVVSILLIGFDSGLMFFSKWIQSEQNKLKIEKENIRNKMAFLQNQISPHFFMNTLNNIHALVDIDTEEAKDAIIRLSKMMDYTLHQSQFSKISLKLEMEFITSYVELMKLRFTDDVELILDIPESLPQVEVPPLLTISFIENAFKYGISYETLSYVHIHIHVENKYFFFQVENLIHKNLERRKGTGIGIENARNRLALIYGSNHQLDIEYDNNKFRVSLGIPL